VIYANNAHCCEGPKNGNHCNGCTLLGQALASMNHHVKKNVNIHSRMHTTESTMQLLGEEKMVAAVKTNRGKNSQKFWNECKRCQQLGKKMLRTENSQSAKHSGDIDNLQHIVKCALPIAANEFGEDSIQYHVFAVQLEELQGTRRDENGNVHKGHKAALAYSATTM